MNPLLHWLTSPEWTHIVGALLHSLWQGAIIALALAILMRRLANPVTRYRCALVALSLVVMAGVVTWAVLTAPKSAATVAIKLPVTEPAVAPFVTVTLDPDSGDKIVALGRMSPPPAPKYWIAWLAVAWMLGAVLMLLRAGIKVAGAEKLRRSCQPLHDQRMVALVTEARRAVGLGRQIRVAVTDKLTSPAVVGVIVPTLILPLSLFTALTPEQIRFILLHELAHIRRGDYFANLFQLLAEALLFFNPAVWWISHQIRREREASCDALAIELSGAPADYARTLVRVAENIMQPAINAALAFGEGQRATSSLADRVQRLLIPGYRPALRLTWRAMLASLIVGGMLLVLSAVGTRSTVGAILSFPQTSTNNPAIPLTDPRSVTKAGKAENSSQEISTVDPLRNSRNLLPLPLFRVRSNELPFIDVFFANGSSSLIPKSYVSNNTATQALVTLTGILTDPQLREILNAIDPGSGINLPIEDQIAQPRDGRAQVLISGVNKNNITTEIESLPARRDAAETTADDIANQANSTSVQPTASPNSSDSVQKQKAPFVTRSNANSDTTFPIVRGSSSVNDLSTRTFKVGPVELAHALGRGGSGQVTNATEMVQAFMLKAGVDLKPPKTVVFKDSLGLLLVRATKGELETIEKFLVQVNKEAASGTLPSVDTADARPLISAPKAILATSVREGSTNLQMWIYRIDTDTMLQVLARQYDTYAGARARTFTDESLLLPEIEQLLASEGVDLQPPKSVFFNAPKGELLLFATKADSDTIGKILLQSNQTPASGKLSPGNPGEAKAMIPVPKANLVGSVEESSTNLLLRVYTVDTKALVQSLDLALGNNLGTGAKPTNDGRTLLPDIQKFFAILGVDLQPPKTVIFNASKGQLLVRATQADLDVIDQVAQVLNEQPLQVNLRAMFVEVPGDVSGDTFLGNLISPPPQSKRNASGKKGATSANAFTGSNVFTGILTEPQFKAVLTALEERRDVKFLSRQDVTTLSGRQAQMQTVEMRSIVTGLRTNLTPGETKGQVTTEQLPFGPVLDVIPFISSDGHTIAMTVIPTVTEFLGYDEPQKNITDYAKSKNMPAELPLPRFRLRQVTTSANVWDGQTLVLGGFVAQEVIRKPDGSEVRQRSDKAEKRSLLVFVTPTIVDPAGNRVNPVEESLPGSPPTSK